MTCFKNLIILIISIENNDQVEFLLPTTARVMLIQKIRDAGTVQTHIQQHSEVPMHIEEME